MWLQSIVVVLGLIAGFVVVAFYWNVSPVVTYCTWHVGLPRVLKVYTSYTGRSPRLQTSPSPPPVLPPGELNETWAYTRGL